MKRAIATLLILVALLAAMAVLASPIPLTVIFKEPRRVWTFVTADPPTKLPVPVEGVKPSQLVDTWGGARSGGRKHEGIDIFGKRHTPVKSTTDGIVTFIGDNSLGGHVVWVLGPGREKHYYAHLESFALELKDGDFIRAGTVVGYVGDSGNAKGTPPHLHYGIYRFPEGAVNPWERLRSF